MSNLDELSAGMRTPLTLISVLFLFFMVLAIVALNKTKRTPKTARFLSSVLLGIDFLAVLSYTLRRFVTEETINVTLQVFGICMSLTAIVNIGIMSVERLVVFNYPNFYIKHVTVGKVKMVVFIAIAFQLILYYFIRYGVCFMKYPDATQLDLIGKCNFINFIYIYICLALTIIISLICYSKIFGIIRYQSKMDNSIQSFKSFRHSIKQYKATSIVIGYLMVIITTGLAYIVIMSLTVMSGLPSTHLRIPVDIVNILNCIIDPCLYVLWFRECRLEILKMISCVIPNSQRTLETMRLQVMSITPSDFSKRNTDYGTSVLGGKTDSSHI